MAKKRAVSVYDFYAPKEQKKWKELKRFFAKPRRKNEKPSKV